MGMGPDSSKRLHSYRLTYFEVVMAKRRGRIVIRDGTGHWGGGTSTLGRGYSLMWEVETLDV